MMNSLFSLSATFQTGPLQVQAVALWELLRTVEMVHSPCPYWPNLEGAKSKRPSHQLWQALAMSKISTKIASASRKHALNQAQVDASPWPPTGADAASAQCASRVILCTRTTTPSPRAEKLARQAQGATRPPLPQLLPSRLQHAQNYLASKFLLANE